MAINVGGAGGGRRSRGMPAMAEINVTPFVDVALVLLIIFMITAHAMDSGVEIDVPKTQSVQSTTKDLPIVSITKAGELYLGKNPVNINDLVEQIHARYPGQKAVYVKGDRQSNWEIGVDVMNALGKGQFGINVVSQFDEGRKR